MPTYSPHQQRMIRLGLRLSQGMPRRVRRSLLAAMAVESNFRHVNYGDRDSLGVLQQRPSQGWGPYTPGRRGARRDIRQFLDRAQQTNQGFQGSAGALAQAVQRSAFPARYDERMGEVQRLMGQFGGGAGGAAAPAMGAPAMGAASPMAAGGNPLAMALLERIGGGKDKPSIMELVQAAQQGQAATAPLAPAAGAPAQEGGFALKPGGGWGGSKGMAYSLARGVGLDFGSEKRDTRNTSSGGVSDHWTGNRNAYAIDLGWGGDSPTRQSDRAAAQIARRLGIRWKVGTPLVATVNWNGYRVQVLYRTQVGGNHDDHIHVGVRRL